MNNNVEEILDYTEDQRVIGKFMIFKSTYNFDYVQRSDTFDFLSCASTKFRFCFGIIFSCHRYFIFNDRK